MIWTKSITDLRLCAAIVGRLTLSLLAFAGHPGYGPAQLRQDLDRFPFLLGGRDGEDIFGSR